MNVKLQLKDFIGMHKSLTMLGNFSFDEKISYRISRSIKNIVKLYNEFENKRRILIQSLATTEFDIVKIKGSNKILTSGICKNILPGNTIRLIDCGKNTGMYEVKDVIIDEETSMYCIAVIPGKLIEDTSTPSSTPRIKHQYVNKNEQGRLVTEVNPLNGEIYDEHVEKMMEEEFEMEMQEIKRSDIENLGQKIAPNLIAGLGDLYVDDLGSKKVIPKPKKTSK